MRIQYRFLIIIMLLQSTIACKKDASSAEALEGKWGRSNEWDNGYTFHQELNFKSDGTVEILGSVVDLKTASTKGYLGRETGTYAIKGDSIVYTNMIVFSANAPAYKEIRDLELVTTYNRYSQKLEFDSNKKQLTLTYAPCNDSGDCVGSQTYFKNKTLFNETDSRNLSFKWINE